MKAKEPLQTTKQFQDDLELREKELPGQERALTRAQDALSKGPPGGLDTNDDLIWTTKLRKAVERAERVLATQKALIEKLKIGDNAPAQRVAHATTTSKLIRRAVE